MEENSTEVSSSLTFSNYLFFFIADWIGIGFSDYGEPQNADLCVLWSDWKGKLLLEDTHTNGNETFLLEDPQQDCRDFQIEFLPNTIHFMFKRKFDSCDENDYVLEVKLSPVILESQ